MARVRVRIIRARVRVRNSGRGYESADNLSLIVGLIPRPPPSLCHLQYE